MARIPSSARLVSFLFVSSMMASIKAGSVGAKEAQLVAEVRSKGWIVFSARTENSDWDLFLMRPDGSRLSNITKTPKLNEMGGRFSPNGEKILFRQMPMEKEFAHDQWGAQGQLVIAHSNGASPVSMGAPGEYPWASWGPDGKQVACLAKQGIQIYDLASKKLIRSMSRKGIYQQFFWSPDGKWFCGPANHSGEKWTVVRMDALTGEVNPVSSFQNCTPDWFPDSSQLIFSYRPANQEIVDGGKMAASVGEKPDAGWTQLWRADGAGKKRTLVYGEDGRHIYCGAISSDGKYVLFTRSPKDGIGLKNDGAPIGLMRLSDAPVIRGDSIALRRLTPRSNEGPVLELPTGWEPHWTSAHVEVPRGK